MSFEIILPYFSVIAALALLWPRGYLLVYLIDRTKSFRFGFNFFIFLFERRLVLPHVSRGIPFLKMAAQRIWSWSIFEKIALVFIFLLLIVGGIFAYRISLDQQYV